MAGWAARAALSGLTAFLSLPPSSSLGTSARRMFQNSVPANVQLRENVFVRFVGQQAGRVRKIRVFAAARTGRVPRHLLSFVEPQRRKRMHKVVVDSIPT